MLDNIEAAYARQVHQYNKLVFQGSKSRTALHQKFAQVAEEFNDPVSSILKVIKNMIFNKLSCVNIIIIISFRKWKKCGKW